MPKIDKNTIKLLPKNRSLKIYKKENLPNYYCSFYVGSNIMKSGNKEMSLRTSNVKKLLKYKMAKIAENSSTEGLNDKKENNLDYFCSRVPLGIRHLTV